MKPAPTPRIVKADFDQLVRRNVEAVGRIEQASHSNRTRADVVSDAIAGFCGSTLFVYVHIGWFGAWLLWNTLRIVPHRWQFDPPSFNMLTLTVSLEAIFLSTFILISQNRQQRLADQRNHLDLQINLLAEQESSQMLMMMKQVMDHLGITTEGDEIEVLAQNTDPERLSHQIQEALSPSEPPLGA